LTAYGEDELKKNCFTLKKMIEARPDTPFSFSSAGLFNDIGTKNGRMAYLFPGRGSQYLGMGKSLAAAFPSARLVFDRLCRLRFSGHTIEEINGSEFSRPQSRSRMGSCDMANIRQSKRHHQ